MSVIASDTIYLNSVKDIADVADRADTNASTALQDADDAKKVATNYLAYSQQDGLTVGYKINDTFAPAKTIISGSGVEIFDENGDSSAEFTSTQLRLGDEEESYTTINSDGLRIYAPSDIKTTETFEQDGTVYSFTLNHDVVTLIQVKGFWVTAGERTGSVIININDFSYDDNVVTYTGSYSSWTSFDEIDITYTYIGSDIISAFTTTGVQIGRASDSHIEMDGDSEIFYDNDGNPIASINSDVQGSVLVTEYKHILIPGPGVSPIEVTYTLSKEPDAESEITIRNYMYQSWISPGTYYDGAPIIDSYVIYQGTARTITIPNNRLTQAGTPIISYDGNKTFTISLNSYVQYADEFNGLGDWFCHFDYYTQSSVSNYIFGKNANASASYSFAQGENTTASGIYSFAEGKFTEANGVCSHASGYSSVANGDNSFAMGQGTRATYDNSLAIGKFNRDGFSNNILVLGDGTNDYYRHNSAEFYGNGYVYFYGSEDSTGVPQLVQQVPDRRNDTYYSGAPAENISYGGFYRYDYSSMLTFYNETWRTSGDDVYTSYATRRRLSNSQSTYYVNAFYQHVDGSGNPSITFNNNDTRNAWVSALGLNDTTHAVNGSATSVQTAKDTTLCNTGSLPAGQYIIVAEASFAANTSGRRVIFLTNSSTGENLNRFTILQQAPSPSSTTILSLTYLARLTSATTFYLRAYQNSGSTLSVTGGIDYIRLHY